MKYSKQFVNTFTIAFMIVYFFTIYGIKLAGSLSLVVSHLLQFVYKFLFNDFIDFRQSKSQSDNFELEFKLTVLMSSISIIIQLLLTIRKFHNDLINLHKGENFFSLLLFKYKGENFAKKVKKRDKALGSIISNSLHFPGYLIAHMVYGYILLFISFFAVICFIKFSVKFPMVTFRLFQLLVPFLIILFLKYFLIEWFLPRFIFLKKKRVLE